MHKQQQGESTPLSQPREATVPTYAITIGMPLGEYVLEVPTFQGIEAAKRRARMTVASLHPTLDLRAIIVMDAAPLTAQS